MGYSHSISLERRRIEDVRRSRLLVIVSIGFAVVASGFSPVVYLMGSSTVAAVNQAFSMMLLLTPLIIRWTGSYTVAGHGMILIIVVQMSVVSSMLGGLHSGTLFVLYIPPIMAIFLFGVRAGYVWTAIVLAIGVAFFAITKLAPDWFTLDIDPAHNDTLFVSTFALNLIMIMGFTVQYDKARNQAFAVVDAANRRMTKMMGRIDATSEALGRSAAQFLGVSPGEDGHGGAQEGLTQQMMATAQQGRKMITSVGDSIRGMIEQYTHISSRIQELHKQSGTITELVNTIDKISDRLDIMALNTGIEAANAGAAGRRFGLLADDMKRLAQRVLGETRSIKRSIRAVQLHTQFAIDASMAGQVLTDEGSSKVEAMSGAFDEMFEIIERLAKASTEITHDTMTQLEAIQRLVEAALKGDVESPTQTPQALEAVSLTSPGGRDDAAHLADY